MATAGLKQGGRGGYYFSLNAGQRRAHNKDLNGSAKQEFKLTLDEY